MIEHTIIFCFPYRGVGGVSMLFMRLATYLRNQGYKTALIDYTDGYMAKNRDFTIDLIPYDDDCDVMVPNDSTIIFQSMTPWSIFPSLRIHESTKLFFITTLPSNFYPLLPGQLRDTMNNGGKLAKMVWHTILFNEFNKSKQFLKLIEAHNANVFLDADILCNLKNSFNIKLKYPTLMPLFSDHVEENLFLKEDINKQDSLKIGWVGRLADFKIHILNKVIQDAFEYSSIYQTNIEFFIVGGGNYASSLLNLKSKYFSIVKQEYLKPSELNDFLLSLDIHFAMGTSALESAKLGVPTVVLDYAYHPVSSSYQYKYFQDVKGFCMGQNIASHCFENGLYSFKALIEHYSNDKTILSKKVFHHYREYHSIKVSSSIFLKKIQENTLQWKDFKSAKVDSSFLYTVRKFFK